MTRLAAAAALVAVVACGACGKAEPPAGLREADRPAFGGDFTLTNQDDRPFRLQDVRGKAAFLFFGYTSCPDMCPVTMSRIAGAIGRVGKAAPDVVTLFVSVDPERDTPPVLKEYVASFGIPVIGLTGSDDQVRRVQSQYHASAQGVSTGTSNYLVNHTSAIFLLDRQGRLRQYFKYDESPEILAAALRAVLDDQS